jgi:hypothetical protein
VVLTYVIAVEFFPEYLRKLLNDIASVDAASDSNKKFIETTISYVEWNSSQLIMLKLRIGLWHRYLVITFINDFMQYNCL